MKTTTKILLTICAVFATVAPAYASNVIATIAAVKGEVTVLDASNAPVAATINMPLEEGQRIVTGAVGRAQLIFADDSLFTIGRNSEVDLADYAYDSATHSGHSSLHTTKGVVSFVTGKMAKKDPSSYKVTTPFATIGVRGSGGVISVAANGVTKVGLTQCCLDISARGVNAPAVPLDNVGTFTTVNTADSAPSAPVPLTPEVRAEFDAALDGDSTRPAAPAARDDNTPPPVSRSTRPAAPATREEGTSSPATAERAQPTATTPAPAGNEVRIGLDIPTVNTPDATQQQTADNHIADANAAAQPTRPLPTHMFMEGFTRESNGGAVRRITNADTKLNDASDSQLIHENGKVEGYTLQLQQKELSGSDYSSAVNTQFGGAADADRIVLDNDTYKLNDTDNGADSILRSAGRDYELPNGETPNLCETCAFAHWGFWKGQWTNSATENQLINIIPFVSGEITPASFVSDNSSLEINHTGGMLGQVYNSSAGAGGSLTHETGTFSLIGQLNSFTMGIDFAGYEGDIHGLATSNGTFTTSSQFVDSANFDINGAFFGDNAQEVGGSFTFKDIPNHTFGGGVFLGTQ